MSSLSSSELDRTICRSFEFADRKPYWSWGPAVLADELPTYGVSPAVESKRLIIQSNARQNDMPDLLCLTLFGVHHGRESWDPLRAVGWGRPLTQFCRGSTR